MKVTQKTSRHALPVEQFLRLSEFPTLTATDSILVVVPHPDDETLICHGLVQRASAAGLLVQVLLVTSGNKWGKEDRRRKESVSALGLAGVPAERVLFAEQDDGKLPVVRDRVRVILQEAIDRINPSIVITTDPEDTHPDHALLGELLQEICADHSNISLYGGLVHYRRFPRPIGDLPGQFLPPPTSLTSSEGMWYRFMLTDAEQQLKRKAILLYRTQLFTPFLRGLLFSFNRKNELYRALLTRNHVQ